MTQCTCKAEHWQPHAEGCPAKVERPPLTLENIRSGAVPSDAVAVGYLLGEIERLHACWSEALGNVTVRNQELERLRLRCRALAFLQYGSSGPDDPWQAKLDEVTKPLHAEIERLRTALNRVRKEEQELAGVTYHIANDALAGVTHEPPVQHYVEIGKLVEIPDGEPPAHPNTIFVNWNEKRYTLPAGTKIYAATEPASREAFPQAPIAKITVRESGAGHYAPDDVYVSLYAPGLPPGEHDVYCEPMSVAPALKSSPADLVGALQDVVHTDPGPVRAGRAVRPHRSGGQPVAPAFRDERLHRIDKLMNAPPGTPEGAELDKLVDEQVNAEKSAEQWVDPKRTLPQCIHGNVPLLCDKCPS